MVHEIEPGTSANMIDSPRETTLQCIAGRGGGAHDHSGRVYDPEGGATQNLHEQMQNQIPL